MIVWPFSRNADCTDSYILLNLDAENDGPRHFGQKFLGSKKQKHLATKARKNAKGKRA